MSRFANSSKSRRHTLSTNQLESLRQGAEDHPSADRTLIGMYLGEFRTLNRHSAHQALLTENETGNRVLAPQRLNRDFCASGNKGDLRVDACLPVFTAAELLEYLIGHKQDDHVVLLGTNLPSHRTLRKAVIAYGLATDQQCALAVLPSDHEPGLGDAWRDEHALGALEIFGASLDFFLETVHPCFDAGVDLSFRLRIRHGGKQRERKRKT